MKSKTIIISAIEENNTRGILTLFQEDDLLKCRLRAYNLEKLSRYCKLGIYHENEVFSANLIERNGVYESSFVGSFDIDKDFYIALIDTAKNNQVLLAGGTYQGFYFNDNSVFLDNENFTNQEDNRKQNLQETKVKEEICMDDCDKCAKCKYKEFFYSQNVKQEQKEKDLKSANVETNNIKFDTLHIENQLDIQEQTEETEIGEKEKIQNLINSIIPQFDSLFNEFEQDLELGALIENSKFVKIKENGENFSIGAIYEESNIKFICYAVKRDYNINPPQELGENYQWLPLDREDPLSVGYYVVFQDASDLKIIKV